MRVQAALASLPARHRECLTLYYLEGKNISEAAGLLGISETAFKTRMHRARKVLRSELTTRMEVSLEQLRPPSTLVSSIMLALPAKPLALSAGSGFLGSLLKSSGLLGETVSGLVAFMVWLPFVPLLLVGVSNQLEAWTACIYGWPSGSGETSGLPSISPKDRGMKPGN